MSSKSLTTITKDKRRAYYEKNKEALYRKHRIYVQNHSEERKKYLKEYWADPINQQKRRDWYKRNVEKIRARDKAHYHKTKERHTELHRSRHYGISVEDYRALIARGKCDICGITENVRGKSFSIDHCHKTGKVRGLLCNNCNHAIGLLKEDTNIFDKAKEYLVKHAALT